MTTRKDAVDHLLEAIEGLAVEQILEMAADAERKSGWRAAMKRAEDLGRKAKSLPEDTVLTYGDLQAFVKRIKAREDVSPRLWTGIVGEDTSRKRANQSRTITVGEFRAFVERQKGILRRSIGPLATDLLAAWDANL